MTTVRRVSIKLWGWKPRDVASGINDSRIISIAHSFTVSAEGGYEALRVGRQMWGFPSGSVGKNVCQCRRQGFNPWVGKIP